MSVPLHPPVIAVGVDGSPSSLDALRWAVAEASASGAVLEVITAWSADGADPCRTWPDDADSAERILETALTEVDVAPAGLEARPAVVEGRPATILAGLGDPTTLVVVGSLGHGAFPGMRLGSVSANVAANATGPVVVVRRPGRRTGPGTGGPGTGGPGGDGPGGGDGPKRRSGMVIGVDGSGGADRALRWAAARAERDGTHLEVVLAPGPGAAGSAGAAQERLAGDTARMLGSLTGPPPKEVVAPGPTVPALLEAAAGAELLVLGAHGHGRPDVAGTLGSVTLHCLAHATGSVAVVH